MCEGATMIVLMLLERSHFSPASSLTPARLLLEELAASSLAFLTSRLVACT